MIRASEGAETNITSPDRLARSFAQAIGERVRQLRARRGWSQKDLGSQPGLSHTNVRNIEGDNPSHLRLDTLAALMLAFDLASLDQLVGPAAGTTAEIVEEHWAATKPPLVGT